MLLQLLTITLQVCYSTNLTEQSTNTQMRVRWHKLVAKLFIVRRMSKLDHQNKV